MELVSVVVPVYKVEQYLERCVKSICEQTYQELEIILVNDGSPDRCGEMCEELAQKDNRIQVLHKQNGGLSDARNAGVKLATGLSWERGDVLLMVKNMQLILEKFWQNMGCRL